MTTAPSADLVSALAYVDASGLPVVLQIGRFTFACNLLGAPSVRPIADLRVEGQKRAFDAARKAAEQAYGEIVASMAPAWLEANRAMYR